MKRAQDTNIVQLFKRASELNGDSFLPSKMYPINPANIATQTERAICFNGKIEHRLSLERMCFSMSCWFPKSLLVGVFLPGWLFASKAKEARDGLLNIDRVMSAIEQGNLHLDDFFLFVDEYTINLDADFTD